MTVGRTKGGELKEEGDERGEEKHAVRVQAVHCGVRWQAEFKDMIFGWELMC